MTVQETLTQQAKAAKERLQKWVNIETNDLQMLLDESAAKDAEIARLHARDRPLDSAMDFLQAASLMPNDVEWLAKSIKSAIASLKAAGVEWGEGEGKL